MMLDVPNDDQSSVSRFPTPTSHFELIFTKRAAQPFSLLTTQRKQHLLPVANPCLPLSFHSFCRETIAIVRDNGYRRSATDANRFGAEQPTMAIGAAQPTLAIGAGQPTLCNLRLLGLVTT